MSNDRREFMKLAGATAAAAGVVWAATRVAAQVAGQFKAIRALAFDAYGTLFDVFSVNGIMRAALSRQRQSAGADMAREAIAIQPDAQPDGPPP